RDAPMQNGCSMPSNLRLKLGPKPRICGDHATLRVNKYLKNKFERPGRLPAASQHLTEELEAELAELPTQVIAIEDSPPIAPRAPLTPDEVRAILMRLMLAMFLAALDQTIVATALPTI